MSKDTKVEVLSGREGAIQQAREQMGLPLEAPKPVNGAEPTPAPATNGATPPDEEDENGLTEAQRKELTSKMQRAIGKKHWQYKEADERAIKYHAEAVAERQRVEALEKELAEYKAKAAPAKTAAQDDDPEPVWEEGGDPKEYWKQRDAWNRRLAVKEFREMTAKEAAERDAKAAIKAAEDRVTAAREAVPDWQEKVSSMDTPIPDSIKPYMVESEMLPELAYYFAENPDELESLGKLSAAKALVAIGKIEAKLTPFAARPKKPASAKANSVPDDDGEAPSAPPSPTARAPSKAPDVPIITPVPSGSDSQVRGRSTSDAMKDYENKTGRNLYRRQRH